MVVNILTDTQRAKKKQATLNGSSSVAATDTDCMHADTEIVYITIQASVWLVRPILDGIHVISFLFSLFFFLFQIIITIYYLFSHTTMGPPHTPISSTDTSSIYCFTRGLYFDFLRYSLYSTLLFISHHVFIFAFNVLFFIGHFVTTFFLLALHRYSFTNFKVNYILPIVNFLQFIFLN